jgi:hypothetical protein
MGAGADFAVARLNLSYAGDVGTAWWIFYVGRESRPTRHGREATLMAKPAKLRRDAVSPFRDKLWDLFSEQASGMDGADIVLALRQAGEESGAVGIDDTYSSMKHQDDEALGNAFDITWLTVVCIKLKEIKAGKKPRARAKSKDKATAR